mmetsp:Transcript_10642/g.19322  ORF Transcript_10642/g.19322 Transcript_10642/m.19322 type:complete len:151 (+) Transcript_10642:286-738(+)
MLPLSDPITKVYQDDFSPARGNALQAAVASIFNLPLRDVPNFIESPDGYEVAIQQFYNSNQGGGGGGGKEGEQSVVKMKVDESHIISEKYDGMICILRGKSPRGDFGHVVVARYVAASASDEKFEMLHDPHPDGTFLDVSEAYGWCMFFL